MLVFDAEETWKKRKGRHEEKILDRFVA